MLLTQSDMRIKFESIIERDAHYYKKKIGVEARRARKKERIVTNTSDGKETENIAKVGDFIVKNLTEAGEEYIISEPKFRRRYKYVSRSKGSYNKYSPKMIIKALELKMEILNKLNLPPQFYFIAAWGEKMVAKEGDFLAQPPDSVEYYRIARKEFYETYDRFHE